MFIYREECKTKVLRALKSNGVQLKRATALQNCMDHIRVSSVVSESIWCRNRGLFPKNAGFFGMCRVCLVMPHP
jgi:hypothetical protein